MIKIAKVILAVGLPATAVAATGLAVAYWTATGSGSGTVTAGSVGPLELLGVSDVTGLVPGGSRTIPVSAKNPDPTASIAVSTLTAVAVISGSPACDRVSGATVTAIGPGATVVVAPGATAPFGTVTVGMADSAVNQDACKGQTFVITLTAA
jgi:hypothetical protein